jgi:hypothetical protein
MNIFHYYADLGNWGEFQRLQIFRRVDWHIIKKHVMNPPYQNGIIKIHQASYSFALKKPMFECVLALQ